MQVKLVVEYDGSNYCGWQVQVGQDSIQGQLEDALARIFGTAVRVRGSGRTDAGAHALGQTAAARLPRAFEPAKLKSALNALLPSDIAIRQVVTVAEGFDPRRDARRRVYEYRILNRGRRSAFDWRYAWLVREPLDVDAMRQAAALFVGEHDFAAFRAVGSGERSTMRRIYESRWTSSGERLVYHVEANAFLRHMVRTMVATMVAVGRRTLPPESVEMLIRSRNRALAPATAPACGLFLIEVRYE